MSADFFRTLFEMSTSIAARWKDIDTELKRRET
jgi:hypothetical protein